MPSKSLFVVLALLGACDKAEPAAPVADAKKPAETKPAEAKPADAKPADAKKPAEVKPAEPKPAAERFVTADKLVDVPKPPGDGWECLEQSAPEPETTLAKCRHTDRAKFFFMMAKDYVVPADQKKTPQQIADEVFPATYKQLFASHTITSSKPVELGGRTGHELVVTATHASLGEIAKRELVFVEGDHAFILSAEGQPEQVKANAANIDAWFATTKFQNAPPKI
jgi:hypothetical protein